MNNAVRTRIAKLTDEEILSIWLASNDPENPTPEEMAALELMEERNLDF